MSFGASDPAGSGDALLPEASFPPRQRLSLISGLAQARGILHGPASGRYDPASGVYPSVFEKIWPDTSRASGGEYPMSAEDLYRLRREGYSTSSEGFVKHLLSKHDGEARIVINHGFTPLPQGVDFHASCFWHYQYVHTADVRRWLHER